MASLVINGDTSGGITLAAPAVAGSNTQTLVATTGTLAPIVSGTAVASTSGTSIDFTGIPSWVKRITVMFNGVSTNGTSIVQVQIGSGSIDTTGYTTIGNNTSPGGTNSTAGTSGFFTGGGGEVAASSRSGQAVLTNVSGNTWVSSSVMTGNNVGYAGGTKTLSGTLDRVRITTVNGTDTFDAGTINILYE